VSLPRKLTDEESKELRILLLPYFHASNTSVSDDLGPEDISDFLDYAFAMISNHKSVDYVIQELLGMEMDFCSQPVAEKVGKEMARFLKSLLKQDDNDDDGQNDPEGASEGEDDDGKNSKVVSLKVRGWGVCG
jgi:hypothetical protein